jgi:apolipoprotein N-acyltransferase
MTGLPSAIRLPDNKWARRGLALAAGLCICFAMPPWGWWPLAPIGIGLWALLMDRPTWKGRFWVGAVAGLGWFLPSTLWMFKFTPVGWPVGVAIWFPFILGAASAISPPGPLRFAGLPAGLILSEWVRWHAPFGGVPLSMLAMTQSRGPLLAVARIGGSLGVSAAVAVVGAAVGLMADGRWRTGGLALGSVVVVAALGVIAPQGTTVRTITAAAVQGGGPQETRSDATDYDQVFQRHVDATTKGVRQPVDLIVWPEDVVNVTNYAASYQRTELSRLAQQYHSTIVAGIVEDGPDDKHFYNAAVGINPDGRQVGRYEKVRRVPFGEYVPLRFMLDPIAGSILPGKDAIVGTKPNVLNTAAGRLGVVVSWEVFFGRRVRESIHHDAQIVLNPTNGSSYWLNEVQTQQIASSQLRAVESGRWLVQAAPTGFSAIITPSGDIVSRTNIGEAAVVQGKVQLRDGETIAAVTGDLFALLLAALLLGLAWGQLLRSRRQVPAFRHGADRT